MHRLDRGRRSDGRVQVQMHQCRTLAGLDVADAEAVRLDKAFAKSFRHFDPLKKTL